MSYLCAHGSNECDCGVTWLGAVVCKCGPDYPVNVPCPAHDDDEENE